MSDDAADSPPAKPASDSPAADLRRAFEAAALRVTSTADPDAFGQASALRDTADELVGEAAILRAEMAYRLLRVEGLSLAELASRLGISKARADQLIRAAKAAEDRSASSSGAVHGGDSA